MAVVIILLRRSIHCRSVLLVQGGSWCDCMMKLSALRTCGDLSLQWCGNRCFGTSPGKPNQNASPPPDFVVWVRGVWAGCGSWYRMWGVMAPFSFFPTYVPPRKHYTRIVGPCVGLASHQIYRDSSTSRMVLQFASVDVSRHVAQTGHRVNCLPTWSVLWVP
jgi:hypothetical protein